MEALKFLKFWKLPDNKEEPINGDDTFIDLDPTRRINPIDHQHLSSSPILTREFTFRPSPSPSSKSFSKEAFQKYFNLVKFGRKNNKSIMLSAGDNATSSPPGKDRENKSGGFGSVFCRLNKSRSASAATCSSSSSRRRINDDSLLHSDGIQSAILHCKTSLNSSKESSSLSRCTSGSSYDKLFLTSSRELSVSTSQSETSTEKSSSNSSARNSNYIDVK